MSIVTLSHLTQKNRLSLDLMRLCLRVMRLSDARYYKLIVTKASIKFHLLSATHLIQARDDLCVLPYMVRIQVKQLLCGVF